MRSFLLVMVLSFVGSCKKDEPAPADKGSAAVDPAAADRAKRREEMMQGAHDRADRLHDRVAEFDKKIGDAQAKLAAATNEAERKAAEAELRRLQDEKAHQASGGSDDQAGSGSSKGIDLSCANLPLGDKDPACKKNK